MIKIEDIPVEDIKMILKIIPNDVLISDKMVEEIYNEA